ncbi:ATP-dependent DNA helicase DinG [Litoricolaceae bacterium]|nr:ATP-dependent DNA helicase DinG [Litorivicinaceae bacterium]
MTAISDNSKQSIQALYTDFLKAKGLKPRLGQKQMIAEVARILTRIGDTESAPIGFIEAGTGTGKTLAYLVGALPYAMAREMPLVISTATVSLQTQLIEKDIPDLIEATDLMLTVALAKGRRRYLCPIRLEAALETLTENQAIYPDELTLVLDSDDRDVVSDLAKAWAQGQWAGDMDQIPQVISESVKTAITTDHRRCQGRSCRHFHVCPYFNERESWLDADLLVINHDLLMSDLKLGGGVILPPLERMILIIDEAHQLARVASDQFTAHCRIAQSLGAIKTIDRVINTLKGLLPTEHRLSNDLERLNQPLEGFGHLLANWGKASLERLKAYPDTAYVFQNGGSRYRLTLAECFSVETDGFEPMTTTLGRIQKVRDWLKSLVSQGDQELMPETDAELLSEQISMALGRLESIPELVVAFSNDAMDSGDARWLRIGQDVRYATPDDPTDLEFWVSPMEPAGALSDSLWGRIGACILTSATLAHHGEFVIPAGTLGLPVNSGLVVAGAFHYQSQGRLVISRFAGDPRDDRAHAQRIADYLATRIDQNIGMLVLFTSWRLCFQVEELLDVAVREVTLVQGQKPMAALLNDHELRRKQCQISIIFGLQSMAEGLDLPGDLANEVVITRLPFQPPDDPREATLAEYLKNQGRDPFRELSLPAATIRLRQAVGRLIRSESDTGQVTMLDHRLVNTRWGQTLLKELPAFEFVEE